VPEGEEEIEMTDLADERANVKSTQGAEISTNALNSQAFNADLLSRQDRLAFDPRNRQSMLDSIFLTYLEETQKYKKGMTFRLLVWVPMLLALLKNPLRHWRLVYLKPRSLWVHVLLLVADRRAHHNRSIATAFI
jgi:hypothetical protein